MLAEKLNALKSRIDRESDIRKPERPKFNNEYLESSKDSNIVNEAKIQNYESQIELLKKDLAEAKSKNKKIQEEEFELKAELREANNLVGELRSEIEDQKKFNKVKDQEDYFEFIDGQVSERISTYMAQISDLDKMLETEKSKNEHLEAHMGTLQNSYDEIKHKLGKSIADKD